MKSDYEGRFTSRKLVELLLFLNRRFQLSKNSTGKMDEDTILNKLEIVILIDCSVSELLSFYLDALASFLTSERPSVNVCLVSILLLTLFQRFMNYYESMILLNSLPFILNSVKSLP